MKYCVLIALLLVSTLADDILAQSDSENTNVVAQAQEITNIAPKALILDNV